MILTMLERLMQHMQNATKIGSAILQWHVKCYN